MATTEEPASRAEDQAVTSAHPDELIGRLRETFPEIENVEVWWGGPATSIVLVSIDDDAWRGRCLDLGRAISHFFANHAIAVLPTVLPASSFPAAHAIASKASLGWLGAGARLDHHLALAAASRAWPVNARQRLRQRASWQDDTLHLLDMETVLPPVEVLGVVRLVLQDGFHLLFALHGKPFDEGWRGWRSLAATLPPAVAERLENHFRLYLLVCATEHQLAWHAGLGLGTTYGTPVRELIAQSRKALAALFEHVDVELAAGDGPAPPLRRDRRARSWLVGIGIGVTVALASGLLLRTRVNSGPAATESLVAAEAPAITPPHTIALGTDDASPHLLAGWSAPEQDAAGPYRWATGNRSRISFRLANPEPLRVTIRCRPFSFPSAPPQTLSVWVNSTRVSEHTLAANERDYSTVIPAALLVSGANRVEFRYGYTRVVNDVVPASTDTRSLSVAWRTMTLAPAGPAAAPSPDAGQV